MNVLNWILFSRFYCLILTVGRAIPPARTYAVGGLQPGRKYELRVTAHNAAGASPALYTIETPTLSGTGKFFYSKQI